MRKASTVAQLIDIRNVTISPRALTAQIRIADDAPLFTGDDPEGTDRIADLMPQILDHACYGDGGEAFGEVLGDTELAHLLEHVTVELLARTKHAGAVSAGQTREIDAAERSYELRLACPDDVLVAGALSSAAWIVDWAYCGGGDPEPDIDAIASGLVALVDGLDAREGRAEESEQPAFDEDATVVVFPSALEEAADGISREPEGEPTGQEEPEADATASETAAEPELEEEDLLAEEDVPASRFVR